MRLDRWFKRRIPTLALVASEQNRAQGRGAGRGKRVETSTRLATGQKMRVPPLKIDAPAAPAVKCRRPPDALALADMIAVRGQAMSWCSTSPMGLAVQGGSGTTRHIDGMLESLANKGDTRPVLVHRLDRDTSACCSSPRTGEWPPTLARFSARGRPKKIYWALVEGVPKPAQGRISLFLAKGEGMGDTREAGRARPRENAGRQAWRRRRAAFADLLRDCR